MKEYLALWSTMRILLKRGNQPKTWFWSWDRAEYGAWSGGKRLHIHDCQRIYQLTPFACLVKTVNPKFFHPETVKAFLLSPSLPVIDEYYMMHSLGSSVTAQYHSDGVIPSIPSAYFELQIYLYHCHKNPIWYLTYGNGKLTFLSFWTNKYP